MLNGALLLLADGRLPSGGYAHSGGLEAAVRLGRVRSGADLEHFLTGLATTTGVVVASFAAATCATAAPFARAAASSESATVPGDELVEALDRLGAEFLARTPSPTQREVSVALGRQLLRALRTVVPHPLLEAVPDRLSHPLALGVGAAALGLDPADAARAMLHETLMGPTVAATKLLAIDPFDAHRAFAATLPLSDELVTVAARHASGDAGDLPSFAAPMVEVYAEQHAAARTRLFAS